MEKSESSPRVVSLYNDLGVFFVVVVVFCTVRRALIYTGGSRLISISLLSLFIINPYFESTGGWTFTYGML